MDSAASLTQPALWPLTAIVFLPALVAAFLSLPIVPKAREEFIRWTTLLTTAVVFASPHRLRRQNSPPATTASEPATPRLTASSGAFRTAAAKTAPIARTSNAV